MSITVGDLVEFREGFDAPCWRRGYVRELARHIYKIEVLGSRRVVSIKVGGKGRKGTVRELTGAGLVEAVEAARLLPPLPSAVGVTLRVLQGSASVAVPRPRSRYRSPAYLAEVRARPCCNCGAAAPSDPHHAGQRGVGQKADDYTAVPLCRRCHAAVTDTYAVPGRTREETELLFLRTQVALVSEWAAGLSEMVADHVEVPVLARSAS